MKSLPGILWLAAAPTLLIGQSTYFAPPVTVHQGFTPNWRLAQCEYADIDGDGIADILPLGEQGFLRGAAGFSNWARPSSTNFVIVGAGDFNHDGRVDLLGTSAGTYVGIYEFDSSTQSLQRTRDLPSLQGFVQQFAVADFNGDGWDDILQRRNSGLTLWLNFGGQFINYVNITPFSSSSLFAVDVDNDSDKDVVLVDSVGRTTVHINLGGAFFAAPGPSSSALPITNSAKFLIADCNGDGLADVLASARNWDTVYCLDNIGNSPNLWRQLFARNGRNTQSTGALGDIDGDGDTDLLMLTDSGSGTDLQMTWIDNPGSGASFEARLLGQSLSYEAFLFCHDADGDGDLDIGNIHRGGIDFWENVGPGGAASATVVGTGCGAPPMTMTPTSLPRPGNTMSARIQGTPSPMCTIALGFSNTIGPGGATLPVDLTPIGMPGCHLYQAIDENLGTSSAGVAYERLFAVQLPPDGRLLGTHLYTQAITLSYGVNPLGVVTSNAIDWGIGGQ